MNPQYHGIWLLLYDWQTLIAGFLAIIAAVGTIWATIHSANREIDAANKQIGTAQKQIDITLRIDRRRTAYETQAFLIALESAASVVIDNIKASRPMVPTGGRQDSYSMDAYQARQRVLCPLFPDLRPVCVRLGGDLTALFVRLDQDISAFAADWIPGQSIGGLAFRNGKFAGFHDGLDRIEAQAQSLQQEAQIMLTRCSQELRILGESEEAQC